MTDVTQEKAPNFEGHDGRECGEHHTVGTYRAWCFNCTEWCYPRAPCRGCELPQLRQALWDVYGILGFDQDGDATPGAVTDLVGTVIEAAKEFRKDYDDACTELHG